MKSAPGFGEASTAALTVSILSGFVVALQYEAALPFVSAVAMEAELPFGAFWRSLHFWSSQFFVVLLVAHIVQRLDALPRLSGKDAPASGKRRWAVAGLTFPLAVMALFTGYVLRFDGTGQAAGAIAEHLVLDIPFAGHALNRFLLAIEREGVNRVYTVHIFLTAVCWALGTWYHTRKVILSRDSFFTVATLCAVWACLVPAPIDLPGENVTLIKGPWFFIGIQELLRDVEPFYAGIMVPSIPVAILLFLPWADNRKNWFAALGVWLAFYLLFTAMGIMR